MYCLANICYVCLEAKNKTLININNSLSVNNDIITIINFLPDNLAWLKTMQTMLICEECCLRLRETYQFLKKCTKNGALFQSFRDKLNTTPISNTENEAELLVKLNMSHKDTDVVQYEIQSEVDEKSTFPWQPNIEEIGDVFVDFEDALIKEGIICRTEVDETQHKNLTEITEQTEDVYVNVQDLFVKEEDTWKQEEVDYTEQYPVDNNATEHMDTESDSEVYVSDNAHLTDTDSVTSEVTNEQPHATNKNDLKTAGKKTYECAICKKNFRQKAKLIIHMRVHTGEKPYTCLRCQKSFSAKAYLTAHMEIHSVKKVHICDKCHEWFTKYCDLVRHNRIHDVKPYKCAKCKRYYSTKSNLKIHMRLHSGEKPFECKECNKCFTQHSNLLAHLRIHTGEKPYSCSTCKKNFTMKSTLVRHIRIHTGEKPFKCTTCKQCFGRQPDLVRHIRITH